MAESMSLPTFSHMSRHWESRLRVRGFLVNWIILMDLRFHSVMALTLLKVLNLIHSRMQSWVRLDCWTPMPVSRHRHLWEMVFLWTSHPGPPVLSTSPVMWSCSSSSPMTLLQTLVLPMHSWRESMSPMDSVMMTTSTSMTFQKMPTQTWIRMSHRLPIMQPPRLQVMRIH